MRWFPLFLDLRGRRVVVIGGGAVAERKIDLLLQSGARLLVVAPSLTPALSARVAAREIEHEPRRFVATDLDGARLAVAATNAPLVNRAIGVAAEARNIPVNVVDNAGLSTGIMPAIVDRSPLVIAIGTEGSAPAFARHVRARIESVLDESVGRLASLLERWRERIKKSIPDLDARRRLYERILQGPVADRVREAREGEADALVQQWLTEGEGARAGLVQIVGAGPGDPGLLTLNALRALQSADVVLYDRLVSAEVLKLARREAELIDVGKTAGGHSVAQARIHALMQQHASHGRRVVRLKGGDPFVFGRGGEEIEFLRSQGIAYEVQPGITAALACAAYAGIPLTHRDHAASLRLVTAHCHSAIDAVDWRTLSDQRDTLAIYMAVASVDRVQAELLRHGRSPDTPVAFVENGSRPGQRVLIGTLVEVASLVAAHQIKSPALLIVGEVAALGERLHWYGAAPVSGQGARLRGQLTGGAPPAALRRATNSSSSSMRAGSRAGAT
jgi:uroporphyrin-III C-methyltransferase/precorrin-2 dehydrogenase/sirohydrochlorin ferrochelatase